MAFTIHGLDKRVDERLTERARRENTSKNQYVKRLLTRAMGMSSGDTEDDEYREFLGRWTREDLAEFERLQADNSVVDEGDWQ